MCACGCGKGVGSRWCWVGNAIDWRLPVALMCVVCSTGIWYYAIDVTFNRSNNPETRQRIYAYQILTLKSHSIPLTRSVSCVKTVCSIRLDFPSQKCSVGLVCVLSMCRCRCVYLCMCLCACARVCVWMSVCWFVWINMCAICVYGWVWCAHVLKCLDFSLGGLVLIKMASRASRIENFSNPHKHVCVPMAQREPRLTRHDVKSIWLRIHSYSHVLMIMLYAQLIYLQAFSAHTRRRQYNAHICFRLGNVSPMNSATWVW